MDPYATITDQILALLERGTVPWHYPWSVGCAPMNLVSRKSYRGINLWLLAWQPYASPYWVTDKQLQKIGGHVRTQEQGTTIAFWKKLTFKNEQNRHELEDGQEGESSLYRLAWVFRTYRVYNVDQCELSPRWTARLAQDQPPVPVACTKVMADVPLPPVIEHGSYAAYYHPVKDEIHLPSRARFESMEAYYATLFHELVHSTGHQKRLARRTLIEACPFGSTNYSQEELVAEMGAAFLCGHTGISSHTINQSAAYIDSWMAQLRKDRRLVVHAAAQAQKAVEWVIGITPAVNPVGRM